MSLLIKDGKFHLNGTLMLLIGGSVHYWRLDRSLWSEILDKVKEMGFQIICTYVPWSVHEIERGKFDFGEINPNLDLEAFLWMCVEKDLYVILRPGPHINSEITYFGFPKRIVLDPEIQSVTADGTPVIFPSPPRMFPVPGYASEKFYEEVSIFFDHVCPIITRNLHPMGNIIAVQADNELSFFLRTQPYDHDYSTGSLNLYRNFLKEKYENIEQLNQIYATTYDSFDIISPPYDFNAKQINDLPFYLDWIEYKEYYLQYGIRRITDMLRERKVDTLIFHNLPGVSIKPPHNLVEMEKVVDVVGFDLYYYKEEYHKIKKCIEYLSGTSRAVFIPEFASGFVALPFPIKPIMLEDTRFTTLAALMHGFAGINFYMLVERERWVGSPIDRFGGIRKKNFKFYSELNQIIKKIDYINLTKKSEGILLINRDYARLELASSLLTPIPLIGNITPEQYVSEEELGFNEIIQIEYSRQWDALYYGFSAAKYAVALGDTQMPLHRLKSYRMVAVPTFDYLSRNIQKKLLDYASEGGCLIIGPSAPHLDENMKNCIILSKYLLPAQKRIKSLTVNDLILRNVSLFDGMPVFTSDEGVIIYKTSIGSGSIIHFGFLFPYSNENTQIGLINIIDSIASAAGLSRLIESRDPQIDVTIHTSYDRKIMFLANTGSKKKEVDIGLVYTDVDTDHMVGPRISLMPYSVRILEAISE